MYVLCAGVSESSLVGVGGDSAGGTITASVAHDVEFDFQVTEKDCSYLTLSKESTHYF